MPFKLSKTIISIGLAVVLGMVIYGLMQQHSADTNPVKPTIEGNPDTAQSVQQSDHSEALDRPTDIHRHNSNRTRSKIISSKRDNLDEEALMEELRRVQEADPARAFELAQEGNRRYPDSPYAAERAGRMVKSLALQGRFSEARGEAEKMVNTYPGTPWALEVERHTGAHPRPQRGR